MSDNIFFVLLSSLLATYDRRNRICVFLRQPDPPMNRHPHSLLVLVLSLPYLSSACSLSSPPLLASVTPPWTTTSVAVGQFHTQFDGAFILKLLFSPVSYFLPWCSWFFECTNTNSHARVHTLNKKKTPTSRNRVVSTCLQVHSGGPPPKPSGQELPNGSAWRV